MWCAPSQIQSAPRMGSVVDPLALPAVDQAISAINENGRSRNAALRNT